MATAAEQARWRAKVAAAGRCAHCGKGRLNGCRQCAWCLAAALEKRLRHLEHDRRAHAAMLVRSHDPGERCAASWLTGHELALIGQRLTVDRVDPCLGYVAGNMQLLASRLNRLKWRSLEVPAWEVERLLRLHRGEKLGDLW